MAELPAEVIIEPNFLEQVLSLYKITLPFTSFLQNSLKS